jgi:hypothetical protein
MKFILITVILSSPIKNVRIKHFHCATSILLYTHTNKIKWEKRLIGGDGIVCTLLLFHCLFFALICERSKLCAQTAKKICAITVIVRKKKECAYSTIPIFL